LPSTRLSPVVFLPRISSSIDGDCYLLCLMHPSISQGIHHRTSIGDTNLKDASVMMILKLSRAACVCIPMKGRIQLLLLHISLQTFLVIMSSFDIRWICLFQIVSSTFDNIRPWFCFIQTLATAIVDVENMCYLWSKPFSFFRSSAIQRKLEFTLSFATMIWVACPLVPK
jgi:hypothetical protein